MQYKKLLNRIHEIQDLRKATRVLTWDREVIMAKGGNADRTHQITTLQRLSHTLYTSDEMGTLIEAAANELNGVNYQSSEASLIRFLRRDYARARRLPSEFVSKASDINNDATEAWKQARERDDFSLFRPWLERVVEIEQEKAELLGFIDEPYDALLEIHEPGTSTAEVRTLFEKTKAELKPLYEAVLARRDWVDDRFLRQAFDVDKQKAFARYLAEAVGYDFDRGHLATAVHPFSTSLSRNDVRITTRYSPNYLCPSMFATLHEAGHAIYVQNVHPRLTRTPLAKETSAALDESQSRMFENFVGRSKGFWQVHLPRLQALFPGQLGKVTTDQFYRAVNKVQPNFIRVEADELTYNLHIILRFEIEQSLLNGTLQAADLPLAWNEKMEGLIGLLPPTDSEGCLQDIHWTLVGFGYFPTYALGNLYAAQFFQAVKKQIPQIETELAQGNIDSLLFWLRDNIHQYGRMFAPAEIIQQATGAPLSQEAFVKYAKAKFSEVYGL
jgi:carboxypeptidase Taq